MCQGFLMTFRQSSSTSKEIGSQNFLHSIAHTLKCQDRGSSHQAKDLRCARPPDFSGMLFNGRILIQKHLDHKYEYFFYRYLSQYGFYSHMFLLRQIQRSLRQFTCFLRDPRYENEVIQGSQQMLLLESVPLSCFHNASRKISNYLVLLS